MSKMQDKENKRVKNENYRSRNEIGNVALEKAKCKLIKMTSFYPFWNKDSMYRENKRVHTFVRNINSQIKNSQP